LEEEAIFELLEKATGTEEEECCMGSAEAPFMTESGVSLDVKKVIAVDTAASNHKTDDASTDDPKLAIIEEIIGGTSSAEIGAKPVDDNNPSSTGNDASNDDPNLVLSDEKSIGSRSANNEEEGNKEPTFPDVPNPRTEEMPAQTSVASSAPKKEDLKQLLKEIDKVEVVDVDLFEKIRQIVEEMKNRKKNE